MSSVISHIQTDHRNKLCIVRLQPYSSRGRDMKELAALQTLAFLLNSETAVDVKYCIHSNADANKDKELTNKLEVRLCGFCPSQNYSIVFYSSHSRRFLVRYSTLIFAHWPERNTIFCNNKNVSVNRSEAEGSKSSRFVIRPIYGNKRQNKSRMLSWHHSVLYIKLKRSQNPVKAEKLLRESIRQTFRCSYLLKNLITAHSW